MPEFCMIFARKIFSRFFCGGGGGNWPPAPVSYAYVQWIRIEFKDTIIAASATCSVAHSGVGRRQVNSCVLAASYTGNFEPVIQCEVNGKYMTVDKTCKSCQR